MGVGIFSMRLATAPKETKITANWLIKRLVCALSVLLCACGDSSSNSPEIANYTRGDHYALVVYSGAGIGDDGFEDNIYSGFVSSADSLGYVLENFNPPDSKSAGEAIERFFNESKNSPYEHRLLVLGAGEYAGLFEKNPQWKPDEQNEILFLDTYPGSLDVYIRDISLYGVSYMAGAVVADMGKRDVKVLGANPKSKAVNSAITGFIDGYKSTGAPFETDSQVIYLGKEENEGFDFDVSYFLSYSYVSDSIEFVFPVIGGSNTNMFRYLREDDSDVKFLTCGMDADQQYLSDNIAFSIVKRMDVLVGDFMSQWVRDKSQPKRTLETLESRYVDVVVAENYSSWAPHFEKFRKQAIKAEQKYLEEK